MEGKNPSLEVLEERIQSQDVRIRSNYDSVSTLREEDRRKGEALARIESRLQDQSLDLADLKKTLTRILWGLFGAIAVGLMFIVAVATLVVNTL